MSLHVRLTSAPTFSASLRTSPSFPSCLVIPRLYKPPPLTSPTEQLPLQKAAALSAHTPVRTVARDTQNWNQRGLETEVVGEQLGRGEAAETPRGGQVLWDPGLAAGWNWRCQEGGAIGVLPGPAS